MPPTKAVSAYLAGIGRRGGQAKSKAKRRSAEHYRAGQAKGLVTRRALRVIRERMANIDPGRWSILCGWYDSDGKVSYQGAATALIHVIPMPASDGGILLGCYIWATADAINRHAHEGGRDPYRPLLRG